MDPRTHVEGPRVSELPLVRVPHTPTRAEPLVEARDRRVNLQARLSANGILETATQRGRGALT